MNPSGESRLKKLLKLLESNSLPSISPPSLPSQVQVMKKPGKLLLGKSLKLPNPILPNSPSSFPKSLLIII